MLEVWCVVDNKPGHMSQIKGLLNALEKLTPVNIHYFQTSGSLGNTAALKKPDWIICAGHRTHWRALTFKWRYKAKLICLMQPSLPVFLFDACIIPAHDEPRDHQRIIATQGVLNNVPAQFEHNSQQGFILLGGPSKHYAWDDAAIIQQLTTILAHDTKQWVLTSSRRTPASTLQRVTEQFAGQLTIKPVEQTNQSWLQAQYQKSGTIWVTEDSASMVYEALSTGAHVGVLNVPQKKISRVSKGVQALVTASLITSFNDFEKNKAMLPAQPPLQEADRVAKALVARWL